MTYTEVFGGNTIYPSDVSLLHVHFEIILADVQLEWPLEATGADYPLARIIEAHPDQPGRKIFLPAANLASVGETVLFNNFNSLYSFEVRDFMGGVVCTLPPGTCWQVYLAHNDTPQGQWFAFQFGASTATVQPSALAGYGLTVTNTTLSVAVPVINFSTTGIGVTVSNRASAFVWRGAGSGVLNILSASAAGNNFIFHVRNEGGGDLVLDPAGSETINGGAALTLHPGDSASVFTDGVGWHTIGLGQDPIFAFDYTAIDVSPGGTKTLTGSELNRISYKFVGALTSDVTIVVPATIQQYWITNGTTGSFRMFVKTAGGPPTQINQGAKGIYYCDGVNIVLASDPLTITTPIAISDGGTSATTADGALLGLGISTFMLPAVKATNADTARNVIVAARSGTNNDITSMTALGTITTAALTVNAPVTINGAATAVSLATAADIVAGQQLYTGIGFGLSLRCGSGTFPVIISTAGEMQFYTNSAQRFLINADGSGFYSGLLTTSALTSTGSITVKNAGNGGIRLSPEGGSGNTGYVELLNGAGTRTGYIGFQPTATGAGAHISYNNENGGGHNFTGSVIVSSGAFYGDGGGLSGFAPGFKAQAAVDVGGGVITANMTFGNNVNLYTQGANQIMCQSTFRVADTTRGPGNYFMECSPGAQLWFGYGGAGFASIEAHFHGHVVVENNSSLSVTGSIGCNGNISCAQNITAFSDAKLKTNLEPITGALDKVQRITGYTFDRVDLPTMGRQAGLIAQEVREVLPEVVSAMVNGDLTLAYGNTVALLVEAIKELKAEVDFLKGYGVRS